MHARIEYTAARAGHGARGGLGGGVVGAKYVHSCRLLISEEQTSVQRIPSRHLTNACVPPVLLTSASHTHTLSRMRTLSPFPVLPTLPCYCCTYVIVPCWVSIPFPYVSHLRCSCPPSSSGPTSRTQQVPFYATFPLQICGSLRVVFPTQPDRAQGTATITARRKNYRFGSYRFGLTRKKRLTLV